MISIRVKKYFRAFASLFAVALILVMALAALAEVEQPGMEKRGAQSDMGGTPPPGTRMTPGGGMAGSEMTRGTISGEVVNIDPRAGVIEIVSDQGQTQTFKVAEGAKKQLSKIKKGDHVNLNLVLRAVDIRTTGKGGGAQQDSSRQPEQDKHTPGMGP